MQKFYYLNCSTQLQDCIKTLSRVLEDKQLIKLSNIFNEISDDYSKFKPENQYFESKYEFYNNLFHKLDVICANEYNSRHD